MKADPNSLPNLSLHRFGNQICTISGLDPDSPPDPDLLSDPDSLTDSDLIHDLDLESELDPD
jgi:hypothetical protein